MKEDEPMEVFKMKTELDSQMYVKPTQVQELLSISRTTVWRLLKEFTAVQGNERAILEISSTLKLVPLVRFMKWLKSQNGKFAQK